MRKNILIFGHNDATQFIDIFNQYTRLFDKNKYKVTVVYLTGEPNAETRERTIAEEVIFLQAHKKDIRGLKIKAIKQMLTLCRERKFEMVICHRYKPSYIMMWVAQFCRFRALIFVMHELSTMASRGRQLLIRTLLRKNMLFAGVSNAVRDDMRKSLWAIPKKRIITLYNVIDVDHTEPQFLSKEEAKKALNIAEDEFVFGILARLTANKDHRTLINAFANVKKQAPKAKLLIVGAGELEGELKKQVNAMHLTQSVIFTGYLPLAMQFMKAFDCFVLSSKQEAFGRVLLEAMIAKLPIIATDVHGIPEVMGAVGEIVKARNVALLTVAMQSVYDLSAQERETLGEVAYNHACNHYSIPVFKEQFWQLPLLEPLKE